MPHALTETATDMIDMTHCNTHLASHDALSRERLVLGMNPGDTEATHL